MMTYMVSVPGSGGVQDSCCTKFVQQNSWENYKKGPKNAELGDG